MQETYTRDHVEKLIQLAFIEGEKAATKRFIKKQQEQLDFHGITEPFTENNHPRRRHND